MKGRQLLLVTVSEGRSGEIQESQVLPGLAIAIVEEALQRSQTQDMGRLIAGCCKASVKCLRPA